MTYQRFTEKARRVVFFARYEASQRHHPTITVEDMVLATLRETTTVLRDQYEKITNPFDLLDQIRATLPVSDIDHGIELPLSPEAKRGIEEANRVSEIHVTPWLLFWVIYPSINPQVVGILEAHGITRDSLTEKKLV